MRYQMKMPDLSTTGAEIRIARWLVEPGETVKRGQQLVEIETDKAMMEVESSVRGVFVEARVQIDDKVCVGDVIAVLEVETPPNSVASSR